METGTKKVTEEYKPPTRDSVTYNFLLGIYATPPRAVALRLSSPRRLLF